MSIYRRKAINTALVAVIIVLVVVVAAGGYYVSTLSGGNPSTSQTGSTGTTIGPSTTTGHESTTTTHVSTTTGPSTTGTTLTTSSTTPSTTSTTATSTSCGSTYTAGTNTGTSYTVQAIIPFFKALSAMQISWNGTSNGNAFNMTASYNVVYADTSGGVTTYKVNILFNSGGSQQSVTTWVQSNGNVLAVESQGYNITGSSAQGMLIGLMAPFTIESTFGGVLGYYTSYFHSTGTSTKTYGSVTMTVNSYAANSATFNQCGYSATLNTFAMDVGTVPGTSLQLVTFLHINGTTNGGNEDFTLKILSLTKA